MKLKSNKTIIIFSLLLLVFQEFFLKINNNDIFKYIDELLLLLLLPSALIGWKIIKRKEKYLKLFIYFYLSYILIGIVSSVIINYNLLATFLQSFLNFKFLIIFLTIFSIIKKPVEYNKIIYSIIFLSILLSIFQLLSPNIYDDIFLYGGHHGKFIFREMEFSRIVGSFWFTGNLAFFLSIYIGVLLLENKK